MKKKLALLVLGLIIILTIKTYSEFKKIDNMASKLLIPYILWLCLAFYLNLYIVVNN